MHTGAPWTEVPARYGKANSIYRQHLRWSRQGFWPKALKAFTSKRPLGEWVAIDATHLKAHQDACRHHSDPLSQGLGKTKGGRNTKLNALVDARGHLRHLVLRPGQEHDVVSAPDLLQQDLKGAFVLVHKAYVSEDFAVAIIEKGGIPNFPPKKGTKDPLPYDSTLGKTRRLVENFFARLKRSRRVHTRYDRLLCTFASFVILAALDDWIRF